MQHIQTLHGCSVYRTELIAVLGLVGLIALAAVNGTVASGLEGHLGGLAAAITDHVVHGTVSAGSATVLLTASLTAGGAAAGFILEALIGVELLLAGGEDEFVAALTALEGLVFEHYDILLVIAR